MMIVLTIIDKLLDIMLALAGQLLYSEKQSANPETIYNEEKQKIDSINNDEFKKLFDV